MLTKMKKYFKLCRYFLVLMIIVLCYSLIFPAKAEEAIQGQSTIINGGFEDPDLISQTSNKNWSNTNASNVLGWQTTATDKLIEFGWMLNGESAHMVPTITSEIIGVGASSGVQFSEVVSNDESSLYQSLSLSAGYYYNWAVHHRGRTGIDTMAIIITDDAHIDYVKTAKTDIDHFNQIIYWLKAKGVTAPAAGDTLDYTVYSTELKENLSFGDASNGEYFSFTKDSEHTVLFEIKIVSTDKHNWGEYTGTYLSEADKDVLFIMVPFASSYAKDPKTAGNLIDNCSFTDNQGNNLIVNGSFDDVVITNAYSFLKSANSPNPKPGIGWCTTSYDYSIEIGNLEKGNAYGIDVIRNETIYNAPSIREGSQFVELNADQDSSLYQIVNTEPGKMYRWSLSHRGRSGLDTMALIIGPEQSYAPLKTTKTARDQMMQIVDWIKNQTDVAWDIPENGCSEKITIYSPKFNSSGGFALGNDIFSLQKDEIHTEEWSVWIISSLNDTWHDYGEIDSSATYDYEYIVPEGINKSIFGFVSIKSSNSNNTYGNLLDNISFKEYYHINVDNATNGGGSEIKITNDDDSFIFEDEESKDSGWALAGSSITIHLKPGVRKIVGTYINGTFVKIEDWQYDAENEEYTYHIANTTTTVKVEVIYVANTVVYDSRSNHEYDGLNGGCEFSLGHEIQTYVSHAPQADDGWYFVGWKYISPADNNTYMFDAVHKVVYKENEGNGSETFEIHRFIGNDETEAVVTNIPYTEGVTLFAEWKYRQRVISKAYNQTTMEYDISIEGGNALLAVASGDALEKTDYIFNEMVVGEQVYASEGAYINVTASRKIGYKFSGWYDSSGKLVSNSISYTYRVSSNKVIDLVARFEPAGYNIIITCTVENSTDLSKYFEIHCTFSNLRENKVYSLTGLSTDPITINGETVTNPTRIKADESGNATVTIYMKHGDNATLLFVPENALYSIISKDYKNEGYNVRGEANALVLTNNILIDLKYYLVMQTVFIESSKHYGGVVSGLSPDVISITSTSSYTIEFITKYNPSIYNSLNVSLCFFDASGNPKNFIKGTRILMIDFTDGENLKYYSYTVASDSINAIKLDETFKELVTNNLYEKIIVADETISERLVFLVDYVGTNNLAESGRIALVYNNDLGDLNSALNPVKKYVNVLEDDTELTITKESEENVASDGPLTMNISINSSTFTVNTLYEDGIYLVKLTTEGGFPDGTYASISGVKYFSNNGYILISPLECGNYQAIIYFPVPIELNLGKVNINASLLPVVTSVVENPRFQTTNVEFNCIDVSACAIDASIDQNALIEGHINSCLVSLKYQNIDSVKLTIKRKNSDGTITNIMENINVELPLDDSPVVIILDNGFDGLVGETYIFDFVGYINEAQACNDACVVVIGYIGNQRVI